MIAKICWALLGAIHVIPALALFRPALISTLYGVEPGSDSFTLLHHRAALFLAIVAICVWAVFRPEVRQLAVIVVTISMVSFIIIWWSAGAPSTLHSIAVADMIGLPALVVAAWMAWRH